MQCERCHKNPATAVLTQTVNGRTTTEHLCAECAYMNGFTSLFNGFPFSQMMSSPERTAVGGKRCENCGSSLDEIIESGRIGCAECYQTFRTELLPTIQNIHGKAAHVGKRPQAYKKEIPEKTRVELLRDELQAAILEEKFEDAATLRDQIRELSVEEIGDAPAEQGSGD